MKYFLSVLLLLILSACGGTTEEDPYIGLPWSYAQGQPAGWESAPAEPPRFYVYTDATKAVDECGAWSTLHRRCMVVTWENDPQRISKALAPAYFCDLQRTTLRTCLEKYSLAILRI